MALFAVVVFVQCDVHDTCDDAVRPGLACSNPNLCCHWAGTECGTCSCTGSGFECDEGYCASPTWPCSTMMKTGDACSVPAKTKCGPSLFVPSQCTSHAGVYPCGATCRCSD